MDPDPEGLYSIGLGMQVNIKRTDGRVHSACVSGINWDTRSVTVEWFEKSETKGKEVDMDSIVTLNPNVLSGKTIVQEPSKDETYSHASMNSMIKPPEIKTRNGLNSVSSGATVIAQQQGHFAKNQHNNNRVSKIPPAQVVVGGGGRTPRSRHTVLAGPGNKLHEANSHRNNHDSEDRMEVVPNGTVSREQTNQQQANINGKGKEAAAARRKTNVVKEIDKLKKNRDERRMRQVEAKSEKEALMNQDPGNQNWEFIQMIREYRQSLEFNPIKDTDPIEEHQITVCVRKRPMNKKENNRKEIDVITVPNKNLISVHEPKSKVDCTKYLENSHFRFDYAFDESCTNEIVYRYSARPLVQTIFDGGMSTCFAYGQTGSGKTHTMGGDFSGRTQDCKKGIYAMTAKDVFRLVNSPPYRHLNLTINCSFFEIYSGKVFDLLQNKNKLRVLEDGKGMVQIIGLNETSVEGVDDVLKLISMGNSARTSGQTSANSNSSRSHAVFQIVLRIGSKLHGKFSLIDLAGNERGADTSSSDRQTRMEGAEINKSLLALKECIRALGRKGAHLPFRASKLTQVLRDSFIGEKSKTCMIAMISPGITSCEHSLNTLRYADRVKELAAHDPSESNNKANHLMSEEDEEMITDTENDLAQIHSMNNLVYLVKEHEMSGEMLTFHEAISKLQEAEDDMVEFHKNLFDLTSDWMTDEKDLLTMTNQVEYDTEDYTQRLDDMLHTKINMMVELRQKIARFRSLQAEEENASKKMTSARR